MLLRPCLPQHHRIVLQGLDILPNSGDQEIPVAVLMLWCRIQAAEVVGIPAIESSGASQNKGRFLITWGHIHVFVDCSLLILMNEGYYEHGIEMGEEDGLKWKLELTV